MCLCDLSFCLGIADYFQTEIAYRLIDLNAQCLWKADGRIGVDYQQSAAILLGQNFGHDGHYGRLAGATFASYC